MNIITHFKDNYYFSSALHAQVNKTSGTKELVPLVRYLNVIVVLST